MWSAEIIADFASILSGRCAFFFNASNAQENLLLKQISVHKEKYGMESDLKSQSSRSIV